MLFPGTLTQAWMQKGPICMSLCGEFCAPGRQALEEIWSMISFSTNCLRTPQKEKHVLPYKGYIGVFMYHFLGVLKQLVVLGKWPCRIAVSAESCIGRFRSQALVAGSRVIMRSCLPGVRALRC